jgi:hypothetical protein
MRLSHVVCSNTANMITTAIAKADWNAMDANYEAADGSEPLASREG